MNPKTFPGVNLRELPSLEEKFNIALRLYTILPNGQVELQYRTHLNSEDEVNLHLYKEHFSYITDMSTFSNVYRCSHCKAVFDRSTVLSRHNANEVCRKEKTQLIFSGAYHKIEKSVLRSLTLWVFCAKKKQNYPYLITFDSEAMLVCSESQQSAGDNTDLITTHHTIPIVICSNVSDFLEPVCIVEPDIALLTGKFVEQLCKI